MGWWGKLLGGAFGFMAGGPLGAALGTVFGHQFDKGLGNTMAAHEQIQAAFFVATFAVMGRLSKADGRVCPDEIAFAETVMGRMSLTAEQREAAIRLFREGKEPTFDIDGALDELRRVSRRRGLLLRMFLEIQLQAALADRRLDAQERALLQRVCERLGIPATELAQLEALLAASRHFGEGASEGGSARPRQTQGDLLAEAYALLGLPADAPEGEVKRAYRRLMNQHHPDKLVARGLPEEMVQLANGKAQEIKRAYETIRRARGLR